MQEISFKKVYFEIIPNLQNIFRNSKNNSYIFFTKILQLIFFFLHLSCCIHALFIDPERLVPEHPGLYFPQSTPRNCSNN